MGIESLIDGFSSGYSMSRQMKKDREEDDFKKELKGAKTPEQLAMEREQKRVDGINSKNAKEASAYQEQFKKGLPDLNNLEVDKAPAAKVEAPEPTEGMPTMTGQAPSIDAAIGGVDGDAPSLRNSNFAIPTEDPNKVAQPTSPAVSGLATAKVAKNSGASFDPSKSSVVADSEESLNKNARPKFMREDGSYDQEKAATVKASGEDNLNAANARAEILNKHGRYDEALRLQTGAQQRYTQEHDAAIDRTYARAKAGDLKAISELYGTVPDGKSTSVERTPEGGYVLNTIDDSTGKTIHSQTFKGFDGANGENGLGDYIQSFKGYNMAMNIKALREQEKGNKRQEDATNRQLDQGDDRIANDKEEGKANAAYRAEIIALQKMKIAADRKGDAVGAAKMKMIDAAMLHAKTYNDLKVKGLENTPEAKQAYANYLTAQGQLDIPAPTKGDVYKYETSTDANGNQTSLAFKPSDGTARKINIDGGTGGANLSALSGIGGSGLVGLGTYNQVKAPPAAPATVPAKVPVPAQNGLPATTKNVAPVARPEQQGVNFGKKSWADAYLGTSNMPSMDGIYSEKLKQEAAAEAEKKLREAAIRERNRKAAEANDKRPRKEEYKSGE